MNAALRPYLTAGVAIVGASAIAVSPIAPPPADITTGKSIVSNAQVQLTQLPGPLEAWTALFENTSENLGLIIEESIANPAPILVQQIANQVADAEAYGEVFEALGANFEASLPLLEDAIEMANEQFADGDITGGTLTLWQGALLTLLGPNLANAELLFVDLPAIMERQLQRQQAMFDAVVQGLLFVGLGVLSPIFSAITVGGEIGQALYDGFTEGDFELVFNTVLAAPALLADAFFNGGGVPGGGGLFDATIPLLQQLQHDIAEAIAIPGPPVGPAIAALAVEEVQAIEEEAGAEIEAAEDEADAEIDAAEEEVGAEIDAAEEEAVAQLASGTEDASDDTATTVAEAAVADDEAGADKLEAVETSSAGAESRASLKATPGESGLTGGSSDNTGTETAADNVRDVLGGKIGIPSDGNLSLSRSGNAGDGTGSDSDDGAGSGGDSDD